MSKENVKQFFEKVQADEQLQSKLKSLVAENKEGIDEQIVLLGQEQGYEFNIHHMQQLAQDMMTAAQDNGELDEAQLEAVSGGAAVTLMFTVAIAGGGTLIGGAIGGVTIAAIVSGAQKDDCFY